jgi:hypothetical protein
MNSILQNPQLEVSDRPEQQVSRELECKVQQVAIALPHAHHKLKGNASFSITFHLQVSGPNAPDSIISLAFRLGTHIFHVQSMFANQKLHKQFVEIWVGVVEVDARPDSGFTELLWKSWLGVLAGVAGRVGRLSGSR